MLYGIIDIGSNSVRLNVYIYKNQKIDLIFSKKEKLGLLMYVEKGKISKKGIEKIVTLIKNLNKAMNHLKIKKFSYFATASLRNIDNSAKAIETIEKETKINVTLLTGKEEGELGFVGSKKELKKKKGIFIDIGGGSTEIVFFDKKEIQSIYSIPIGSLKLYKKCVSKIIPTKKERELMKKEILNELEKAKIQKKEKHWNHGKNRNDTPIYGIGGSLRALNELMLELGLEKKKNILKISSLKDLEKGLKSNSDKIIEKILLIKPSRIHTLIPGILIIDVLSSYFNCSKVQICNSGVREGYLEKFLSEEYYEKIEL